MASQVMRIILKAYDHQLVDASASKIIETVKKNGSVVSGPVPLPTKKEVVTILRAVHKYKDSREQFEQRTHKRLIDIIGPTQKTVDALARLIRPAGRADSGKRLAPIRACRRNKREIRPIPACRRCAPGGGIHTVRPLRRMPRCRLRRRRVPGLRACGRSRRCRRASATCRGIS